MSLLIDDAIAGLILLGLVAGMVALIRAVTGRRPPVVVLDLSLREGATADAVAFTDFFRSLHAIARPGWRGAVFGQPWVAFEFSADDGVVHARLAMPEQHAEFVCALLQSAVRGIETRRVD